MDEQGFHYTYSAKEQAEVENIRNKYLPRQEDKMEQLRKLDRIPYQRAQTWALCLGVIGALVMGTGMSLAMTDFGKALGDLSMPVGIAVGVAGMVLVALAYPVYNKVLHTQRQRIAPEVLRLSDELMK